MATKIVDYISASQLGQFLFCPLSYRFLYVDGVSKTPGNEYMLYGTAFHEALAHNFRQKITSKVDLPVDEVIETFRQSFKNGLKDIVTMGDTQTIIMTGENALHAYMSEIAPTIRPQAVEYKFELQLSNYPIKILGYIDLITDDDIIIDHKTVGKSTMAKWTQAEADRNLQLTLYSAAFRKENQRAERGLRFDILPRDNKPKFKHISTTRTEDQIHSVLSLASQIEQIVQLGVFFPNLNNCQNCDFRKTCPKRVIA